MGQVISSIGTYVQISVPHFPLADRQVLLAEFEHRPVFLDAQEGR